MVVPSVLPNSEVVSLPPRSNMEPHVSFSPTSHESDHHTSPPRTHSMRTRSQIIFKPKKMYTATKHPLPPDDIEPSIVKQALSLPH